MQISACLSSSEHTIQNVRKMKRKPSRSELSHLLYKTDKGQLPTILFPGETGWWDATGLTDQANQAPFSDCQLRAAIRARNTWWHCKKKPNKCSLWNNTLSASSKLQMTLMQIFPFSSEAITRIVSSMLTRPWVGNNTLGNDCIHPSGLGGLLHAQALFWAAFEWTSLHKAGLRNFVNWLQL